MSSKVTYEQKILLLERYMTRPHNMNDVGILAAIRIDVTNAPKPRGEKKTNPAYNTAMGIYRDFHKAQTNMAPALTGRNAARAKTSMENVLRYLTQQCKTKDEAGALKSLKYIFNNWSKLSDFIGRQITLPDIEKNLSEIIKQIKQDDSTNSKKQKTGGITPGGLFPSGKW